MQLKKRFDHLESQAVVERYSRRTGGDRYSMLRPEVWAGVQERQRAMLLLFQRKLGWTDLASLRLFEVGCGSGGNLLEFLRLGFSPENLSAIELLPDRVGAARRVLPAATKVYEGDALFAPLEEASQDVVLQSVVFSSILDDDFQLALAARMWSWVKPGGGVLWYDFTYNNPANKDVRGISLCRIRELFDVGQILAKRVTLAPPISRRVCRIHPFAYHVFNCIPLLRTHLLVYISKS